MSIIRQLLDSASLEVLFLEQLGWDRAPNIDLEELIASSLLRNCNLNAIAEKKGVVVWHCTSIPPAPDRQRIDRIISRHSAERLLIFTKASAQLWLWPERRPSGGTRLVPHPYEVGQPNLALEQRLKRIRFLLAEEKDLQTLDVRERVRTAFNAEAITRNFYKDISEQRVSLSKAIAGLENEEERQLYASILLDRLMFIYFIQQKGFLDNDREYLSHRLEQVQQVQGPDHFFEFYRDFLVPLFHQGLGSAKPAYNDLQIKELIGEVPYINGGLFSVIPLELKRSISVPDEAFVKVFELFNRYRWHLDERPSGVENEINPEVLGYILEQYINQKDQGAYYTADDIAGFMTGVTITGYFLERMNDASLWSLMRSDPSRYTHEAMRHGANENAFPDSLEPKDWATSDWEAPAPPDVGLPTEKKREAAARIASYRRICNQLGNGQINSVDAATTANLNLMQLAVDWLQEQESPNILLKAWQNLKEIRVLDPTCGSGAFLLAGMKVLQELYAAVLEAIEHRLNSTLGTPDPILKSIADEVNRHPSRDYFLRKTIALHNLYGVDRMAEAVEIARLRLFLALAATVDEHAGLEPLPDLDMNIRWGNTLVGCVTTEDLKMLHEGNMLVQDQLLEIEQKAVDLRTSYQQFQEAQRMNLGDSIADRKADLQRKTKSLGGKLDWLFSKADNQPASWSFEEWKASHQPFHWLAEFPEAMLAGGFSVVVGNPPFISRSKVVTHLYQFEGFNTDKAPDIFAPCMERAASLVSRPGRFAMVAPISQVSGLQFDILRETLAFLLPVRWVSVFDLIPGNLFKAKMRPVITIGNAGAERNTLFTSGLRRWRSEYRPHLFATSYFSSSHPVPNMKHVWPLIGDDAASVMLQGLQQSGSCVGHFVKRHGRFLVGRKTVMNLRFMTVFLTEPPCWEKSGTAPGQRIQQNASAWLPFSNAFHQQAAYLIFAGRFGHWLWTTIGDAFHITDSMLKWFPCNLDRLKPVADQLAELAEELNLAQIKAPMVDRNKKFIGGYDLGACRDITDQADELIMKQLGVGEYWPTILLLDNRIVKSGSRGVKTSYEWLKDWTPTRGPWDPSMPD